ncbi:MAG: aminotransferase class III-fold pyridoxal phosphate-dependent enzyme, partial [Sulfitobacter sp.]|nr:aminotransferase class III-fold pyridoxal phosphate-dependent enzyme [Sulfitobacter sp.]
PIAAVMASEKVVNAILAGSGKLWNGHTYMSHAVATAGAMAVMREIEERDLLSEVRRLGERLSSGLRARLGQHPHVGDIRGRGLFWTAEVVADRATKEPFDVKLNMAGSILNTAKDAGVICYPSHGCADGTSGDHVLLAPCFTSTDAEIDTIVDVMATTIETETAKAA